MMAEWPDLRARVRVPELMDQPGLEEKAHHQALTGLARVHRFSGTVSSLWPYIQTLASANENKKIRLLDIACGGGDILLGLAERAKQAGVSLDLAGCDLSDTALARAAKRTESAGVKAEFFQHDVLEDPLPNGYDVVTTSLFLHHLDEQDIVKVLCQMRTGASQLVLVNDLLRTQTGYALAWLGCRVLSRSPIVHTDGPLSVRAAFTVSEILGLAEKAGLVGARLQRCWPQRFILSWRPSDATEGDDATL